MARPRVAAGGTAAAADKRQRVVLQLAGWAWGYDVDFNPSTQRHYRRLIYYMFRSYDHHHAEKYITTLGLLN
jgi:hypothetical protein